MSEAELMKKLSNSEVELKKSVAYIKGCILLRISTVNAIKSEGNCRIDHIYWKNL